MQSLRRSLEDEIEPKVERTEVEDLPIRVADDWDEIVSSATRMADVIDRHMDFESKLQGRELRPITLCPEQRVSLVTDLSAV